MQEKTPRFSVGAQNRNLWGYTLLEDDVQSRPECISDTLKLCYRDVLLATRDGIQVRSADSHHLCHAYRRKAPRLNRFGRGTRAGIRNSFLRNSFLFYGLADRISNSQLANLSLHFFFLFIAAKIGRIPETTKSFCFFLSPHK